MNFTTVVASHLNFSEFTDSVDFIPDDEIDAVPAGANNGMIDDAPAPQPAAGGGCVCCLSWLLLLGCVRCIILIRRRVSWAPSWSRCCLGTMHLTIQRSTHNNKHSRMHRSTHGSKTKIRDQRFTCLRVFTSLGSWK